MFNIVNGPPELQLHRITTEKTTITIIILLIMMIIPMLINHNTVNADDVIGERKISQQHDNKLRQNKQNNPRHRSTIETTDSSWPISEFLNLFLAAVSAAEYC